MKSIAIVGAGGFVGGCLVESCFVNGSMTVYAVVRAPRSLGKLCRFGSALNIRMADAENVNVLSSAINGCSTVVNVTTSDDPLGIINSTIAIYNACVAARVERLIHLSTAVVYGQVESPLINDDSLPIKKHWMPYARAKAESELFLREVANSSPVEITVLRPGIVWGPRSAWSANAALDLISNAAYLIGDGSGVCNSIYIDNLIACILTCCNHPSKTSGFFNISDEEFVTWYDFYGSLAEYLNYDMSGIPKIPSDRFRPSFNSFLEDVKSSSIYKKLKAQIPEETRASLKIWLKERTGNTDDYAETDKRNVKLHATREMWDLQKIRHKLPNSKFKKYFNYTSLVAFRKGTQMTIDWLKFVGL